MRAQIIDGKAIGAKMRAEIALEAGQLAKAGWQPHLVSVSVGDEAASELYVRNQQRSAESAGVTFEARAYPAATSLEQLIGIIQGLNADPRVNGIIIQRPLPEHIPVKALQKTVHPLKDVEGMHPSSIGNIVYDDLGGEKTSGCLLHAKFLNVMVDKAQEEQERQQHYSSSREYQAYYEKLREKPDLWCRWSEKYINWRQLEILGLMSKGNWA